MNTPEAYSFLPESSVSQGARPGYGDLLMCAAQDFTTVAPLPTSASTEGGLRIIVGDHTFSGTKGFRNITLYRDDSETTGSAPGDPGFKTPLYEVKGFIAGDKAANREFIENLANSGIILLQTAADPANTDIKQYGAEKNWCVVKDYKYSSGGKIKGGNKGYEIIFEAPCMYDYQGVVTLQTS